MKKNSRFTFGHIWLIIWIIVYFMSFFLDCTELLGNKGMDIMNIIVSSQLFWYMLIYYIWSLIF